MKSNVTKMIQLAKMVKMTNIIINMFIYIIPSVLAIWNSVMKNASRGGRQADKSLLSDVTHQYIANATPILISHCVQQQILRPLGCSTKPPSSSLIVFPLPLSGLNSHFPFVEQRLRLPWVPDELEHTSSVQVWLPMIGFLCFYWKGQNIKET